MQSPLDVITVEVKPDQSCPYCSPLQSDEQCSPFDGPGYEVQLSSDQAGFGDPVSGSISVATEQDLAADQ